MTHENVKEAPDPKNQNHWSADLLLLLVVVVVVTNNIHSLTCSFQHWDNQIYDGCLPAVSQTPEFVKRIGTFRLLFVDDWTKTPRANVGAATHLTTKKLNEGQEEGRRGVYHHSITKNTKIFYRAHQSKVKRLKISKLLPRHPIKLEKLEKFLMLC